MALTILTGSSQAAAINYSYSTSGSADWSSVPTASYFYDLIDKKVRYKSANGDIQGFDTFPYTGSAVISGSLTINSGSITMPSRPAFRVTGAGTTNNLTTTQNGDGTLNSNNYAVDYYQGSGFNSGSGVFTTPIAGLYQVDVVGRNAGYASGISQLCVVKNSSVIIMIEWASSSTMNHAGGSTVTKLAVGDTLKLQVLAGQVNFDGNDNWSIAYIG